MRYFKRNKILTGPHFSNNMPITSLAIMESCLVRICSEKDTKNEIAGVVVQVAKDKQNTVEYLR